MKWIAAAIALLLSLAPALPAQNPNDTLLADSLPEDTVDYTARFLEARQQAGERVPMLPLAGPDGPAPALTRIVFTRDSIEWASAATVGDLLTQVPGVFLWRGGFIGRPEPVNYQARGASSVDYYLDGVPYVAAGVDSVAVDPALFSLSFLDRMEVERRAGWLRVDLFTRRNDRRAPRSRIAIARGDGDFARYEAELERRFQSGLGFSIAGEYLNSPTASGSSSGYSNTQILLQGGYIPSPTFGVQYQILRSKPERDPFVLAFPLPNDTIALGFDATRTDAQLRVSLRRRGDGLGPSADLIYGRTGWDGEGIDQQINQLGGYAGYRTPTLALGASGFYRTRWTPLDLRGTFGWSPLSQFTASAELVHQGHRGGRSSDYLSLAAGVQPMRGVALTGSARLGSRVAAPSIIGDTAQQLRDFQATLGYERERVGVRVGWSRTAAFSPFGYAEFPTIPTLGSSPSTNWVTLGVRLAPLRWVTVESWFSDPRQGPVEGLPPTHSLTAVTLRSKFLRQFPSGIFDLKLRLSMETWGSGTIGRDAAGAPLSLPGATFLRSLIQIQLQSFTIYWDRGNLTSTELTYVPGFPIPAYGTTFGVRWEFLN